MGRPLEYNAEEVIEAIKGTHGVINTLALKLGVTRQTAASYIKRWKTVQEAYENEKRVMDDTAVSVIVDDITKERSVATAKWWVERKLKDFKPNLDITSAGEPINVVISYDDD